MPEKSIEEKVKEIIVEQLGVNPEQVTPNASFIEDLGADSLDTVELVMAFEEEFSVEVPDEDAEKLQTVGDVIRYIEERAKAQGANDQAIFIMMAISSFSSGLTVTTAGWERVNLFALPLIATVALALIWFALRERRAAAA